MKKIVQIIFTKLLFYITGFFTFIIVVFILIISIFNWEKGIRTLINFWAKLSFLLIGKKIHVKGIEKVEKSKKYIIVANHGSIYDIMGIMAIFPGVSWFGKENLMKIPVFKKALKAINYVPMKTTDLRNTKTMISQLIENSGAHTIAIFPEGGRTTDGDFKKFRKGFVHVFRATQIDILPITLNGFYKLKPKNRSFINFNSKLEIVINDILTNNQLEKLNNNEITDTVQKVLISSYSK